LGRARDLSQELVRTHPDVDDYRTALADAYLNLGVLYHKTKQPLPAIETELKQSLAQWEHLAGKGASATACKNKLAYVHNNLAVLYRDHRRLTDADAAYQQALVYREELARAHPTVTDYQSKLAGTHHNLGDLYQAQGRQTDAAAEYRLSLALNQKLVEAHPSVSTFAVDLGRNYGRLGHLTKVSNPEAALDAFDRSAQAHASVLKHEPGHAFARECLGHTYAGRAIALGRLTRPAEALTAWNQALDCDDGVMRDSWQLQRAATRARLGDHARAAVEADAVAARASNAASVLYNAACVHALAASAASREASLPESERAKRAEQYAARAVVLLTQARDAGAFKTPAALERLAKDPDLAPLQARDDFKKLRATIGD
jgi:tetratricopeptide (TPR) repeat protein